MINILIPACGSNQHFKDGYWPKNVTEINGKPMIEYTVENFDSIIESATESSELREDSYIC